LGIDVKTYVSARFPRTGKSHICYRAACFCGKDIIIISSIPHNHIALPFFNGRPPKGGFVSAVTEYSTLVSTQAQCSIWHSTFTYLILFVVFFSTCCYWWSFIRWQFCPCNLIPL